MISVLIMLGAALVQGAHPSLPVVFEEAEAPGRYVGRGAGFHVALDESGVSFAEGVRMHFGAAPVKPVGTTPTGGVSNYLLGPSPARWRTGVKHFKRVEYRGLHPGIDLVFYGNPDRLEFDYAVSPGSDPGRIRLWFEGGKLRLSRSGDLELDSGRTRVKLNKPALYQPGGKKVEGEWKLLGKNTVGFEVAHYDRTRALIIDPVLYTTYWGAVATDAISAVATDPSGNLYITGYTNSTSLTTTATGWKRTLQAGDSDAFVAKLNPAGTTILYSTFLGGPSPDYGRAIAVDSTGAAYITGSTIAYFPVTAGAFRQSPADSPEAFAAKLDAAGSGLVYATYLGGAGAGQGIAVDSAGNAWIAGYTYTASFPVTSTVQPVYSGSTDGFLIRLNATGSAMTFGSFFGGRGEDQATAVAVDSAGDAYITGYTSGQGFLNSGGAFQSTLSGATDAFVVKVRANGNLGFSTYLGGPGIDRGYAIAVDSAGNAYVGGQTGSTTGFPTTAGAYSTAHAGGTWDGFVTKVNALGTALAWSTLLGGGGSCQVQDPIRTQSCDAVLGLAVDSFGSVFATGLAGTGFPTVVPAQATAGGAGDGFVAHLSSTGAQLLYSTFIGGSGGDMMLSAAMSAGVPVVAGVTASTNVPVTSGALRTSNPGGFEGVLTRLNTCSVTLAVPSSFFPAAAGSYTLDIFAASTCTWTSVTADPWITVTAPNGTGNGQIQYALATNAGLQRTGTISVNGQNFSVIQVIGSCLQLGYYGSWFPSTGGAYDLPIFATCAWTAISSQPWITFQGGNSGGGNGVLHYLIDVNSTGGIRSGQIDVNGIKFDVNQIGGAGSLSCSYNLSRTQDAFSSAGGSSSLLVTAAQGCEWTVTQQPSWLTVTAGLAGNGDGVVGYTASPNTTGAARSGQLVLAGQTVTVTQSN